MLPFILYLSCGVVTGFHMYSLLSIAVQGAAFSWLELVCSLGSLCLLVAAYISLFRPLVAARIALLAALAIWSFYAPAIAKIVRSRLHAPATTSGVFDYPVHYPVLPSELG